LATEPVPGRGLVAVALTVAAGGDDDPHGRHGTAHLVEHLMGPRGDEVSGTPGASGRSDGPCAGGHVARVEEAGGMCNAETHRDHTVFHTVVPSDALPDVLHWEARRLIRFRPAQATVRSEALIIGEEIRAAGAGGRLWDTVLAALHPGARDAYGTTAELREATAGEADAFFRHHYRADRAVLSVVGDVDAGRVAELVDKEFASWGPHAAVHGEDVRKETDVHDVHSGSARGDSVPYPRDGVAIGHALADPRRALGPYLAQVVLFEVLRRSRLPRLPAMDAGHAGAGRLDAASVSCGHQGQWLASAAPDLALVLLGRARGTGTDEALDLWLTVLGELAAAPPAADELRRAVAGLRAGCYRQADSLAARAVSHGRAELLFGSEEAGPDGVPERLAAVTAPEVSAAARALLAAPRTVHALERVAP
jgi:predicted Zn-dependent peptidase